MTVKTSKAPITTMTLAAILSLSLVVNLPGLAITPILSTLSTIFPDTTETQKQLLTVMPNLLIIPFVLLSGKLSMTRHKVATIVCGLVLFAVSAVAYMFANTMTELIVISSLLGCGAGLIIPFAAGLIADCYVGAQRMKVMGWKSGISNLSLVLATFAVGWLTGGNWHTPFVVYLVCLVPLALAVKLRGIPTADLVDPQKPANVKDASEAAPAKSQRTAKMTDGFYVGKLAGVVAVYFFITFVTMAISYYSPFLIEDAKLPDSLTGTITAIYFLFVFLPGFLLTPIVRVLKGSTFIIAGASIMVGLAIFALVHAPWCLCFGAALAGLGYGICQPLIYDKASRSVGDQRKSTMALAIVLTANYVSIAFAPFIVDGFRDLLHVGSSATFPFVLTAVLTVGYVIVALLGRKSFGFSINKSEY